MSHETNHKPRVFIGSSSEGLEVARAIQTHLDQIAEVTVWRDGTFKQTEGALESLLRALEYYDFAVFAFTPDDKLTSRDVVSDCPRDNVLFEFGLFLGHLNKERCFVVAANLRTLRLPSDLHGVTVARYSIDRADGNYIAATSTACHLVSNEIKRLGRRALPKPSSSTSQLESEPVEHADMIERWGIDLSDGAVIEPFKGPKSGWFHSERFVRAFPGVRGTLTIDDPSEAIDRLTILLAKPLRWISEDDDFNGIRFAVPIWWWRGPANMHISVFKRIGHNIALMDGMELKIRKIAAVNPGAYWQSFVYLETDAQPPTGLYEESSESINWQIKSHGYADEEYAIYQGRPIARAEYDDGAAVIDGKPQRIEGAEWRSRFLTPYNFLISSQSSPINSNAFDRECERLLNGILKQQVTLEELTTAIVNLPRKTEGEYR